MEMAAYTKDEPTAYDKWNMDAINQELKAPKRPTNIRKLLVFNS